MAPASRQSRPLITSTGTIVSTDGLATLTTAVGGGTGIYAEGALSSTMTGNFLTSGSGLSGPNTILTVILAQ